jgi:TetR/AcrR family transcriptional regulator
MALENEKKERLNSLERRSRILDAAVGLFSEKGFSGTRTKDIAIAAGISETLIFHHFKSKEELYRAALQNLFGHHPVEPDIAEEIALKDDFGVFKNLALHLISHNKEDRRILRLAIFSALEGFSMAADSHQGQNSTPTMPEILEKYVEQRIKDNAFKNVNAKIVSKLYIEFVYAYILDQEAGISGSRLQFTDEEVVETMVRVFIDGIKI